MMPFMEKRIQQAEPTEPERHTCGNCGSFVAPDWPACGTGWCVWDKKFVREDWDSVEWFDDECWTEVMWP